MILPEERKALEAADRIIWPDLTRQQIEEGRCHEQGCHVHRDCRIRAALLMAYRAGRLADSRA